MSTYSEMQDRWRKAMYKICALFALIGTVAEIVIYLIDSSTRELFLPVKLYRIRFIYIPSSLNLIVLIIIFHILWNKHFSGRTKNLFSCVLIWFLCFNTQFIHYVYGPLLCLPCIAIVITTLFADKILTLCMTIASIISIVCTCLMASTELRRDDIQLTSDMGLAILIVIITYIAARLLVKFVDEQITYIISSSNREKELLNELQLDYLMGIYNRSGMHLQIDRLLGQHMKYMPIHLLMIDVDDFKQANDTYGHLCGDQVLIYLADLVKNQNREFIPCRYGGEEILLIMPNTTAKEAYENSMQILQCFREKRFDFAVSEQFTFSGGLAAYVPGLSEEEWIGRADALLYEAKENGKNKIVGEI